MRYIFGVLVPLLLQCLLVFIAIEANTGNGSWVGLGAFLLGMFAIPATAIINLLYIKSNKERGSLTVIGRCLLIAAITPFFILILLMVG